MEDVQSWHTKGFCQDSDPLSDALRYFFSPPSTSGTSAKDICLVQSGGGPLVYRSMGWNDRAKLLERAQL